MRPLSCPGLVPRRGARLFFQSTPLLVPILGPTLRLTSSRSRGILCPEQSSPGAFRLLGFSAVSPCRRPPRPESDDGFRFPVTWTLPIYNRIYPLSLVTLRPSRGGYSYCLKAIKGRLHSLANEARPTATTHASPTHPKVLLQISSANTHTHKFDVQ